MQRLHDLIGTENTLDFNSRTMRDFARSQEAAVVGAMHVTCSDESERECVESFQHHFVEDMLPSLKYSAQSPFRTATLGGRYEWGSLALAEQHFALPAGRQGTMLLMVKLNAHVAVVRDGSTFRYGTMDRYDLASQFCGALSALLEGQQLPAIRNLSEAFRSEGVDRVAMLNDPAQVDPHYRVLLTAVASARLQARRAVLDIQNTTHARNALIVVLPCVTMNRPDRDTELIVGMYTCDFRNGKAEIRYRGLGDDPSKHQVTMRHNLVAIADDQLQHERPARDHRQMVLSQWRQREGQVLIDDEQMREIVVLTERASSNAAVWKEMLKTLLRLLADVALVPTAVLLFADGLAGIHNVYRAMRLAQGKGAPNDAADILDEAIARIDALTPQQARKVVAQLCNNYGIALEASDEEDVAPAVSETAVEEIQKAKEPFRQSAEAPTSTEMLLQAETQAKREVAGAVARSDAMVQSEIARTAEIMPPAIELKMATEQRLGFTSLPEPTADKLEPAEMPSPSAVAQPARAKTPPMESPATQSIPETAAIVETQPIIDTVDKADVMEVPKISTKTTLKYEPGPAMIVTDATIGLPQTPDVEIVDEIVVNEPTDVVVDAELIPMDDETDDVEILEPFMIDEQNS